MEHILTQVLIQVLSAAVLALAAALVRRIFSTT
ncbi:hypothetical protein EV385_5376 [Krasilnikovia cinnamomea]|uniref:Uncharacterized protein n=1 Tax=Krasilnikovia cinnamomea TaxID=349313 RepID=A0A4Q7ZSJ4_9ACTN|nr:hypothetical protein EV385_5376 [Krasilnikovia cinnamomea]